jgi:hypothetical protein
MEKPPAVQLLNNVPAFYENRWFITMFTRAVHWSPSWARSTQSIPPYRISQRSILILSSHQNPIRIPLLPMRATFPAHLILFNLIVLTVFGEEYGLRCFSLFSFRHPLIISSLFCGQNILLSTLSRTPSVCRFWRVLTMVYNSQNYWVFGVFPSSGILKNRKNNVSETDPVSETSCFLFSRIPDDGKSQNPQ